ncbi:MAG TPA: hypothetical protein VMT17_11615 [Anaeromyxobacteraceae bacterium]|nr:hypothetical protein [Anaeromyxobacteraceae bacterium]
MQVGNGVARWMLVAAVAAFASGCGGREDNSASAYQVPPYGLRGQIVTADGSPVGGVTVLLVQSADGTVIAQTTSHADGWFGFLVMDGDYWIEPTESGLDISPPSRTADVEGADVSVPPFVARAAP